MFRKVLPSVLTLLIVLSAASLHASDEPGRDRAQLRGRNRNWPSDIVKVIKGAFRGGVAALSDLLGGPKP